MACIRQHEDKILLCCEVNCKVLRTDTVYEQIQEIAKRSGGTGSYIHRNVEKVLLGSQAASHHHTSKGKSIIQTLHCILY